MDLQRSKGRVIVSGMVAGNPGQGGAAWAVLQYVLGLARLGYDTYLFEPLRSSEVRPQGAPLTESANAAYFQRIVQEFDLEDRCSLILESTSETIGLPYGEVERIARTADVLFNISGMLQEPDLLSGIPVRVYLDLDPGFNQLWHATQGIDMRFAAHNHFVTVGNSLGQPGCSIPTCGLRWVPTFQPIVLEYCAGEDAIQYDAFTTVANWRGYGSIEHDGVSYGQKAHSLRQLIDLPQRTAESFILALSIDPGERRDLQSLAAHEWNLLNPVCVAHTPRAYRKFVSRSKAELGIAKSGYVAAKCGWFSDRSVCYLACGRPVVAQETGFSEYLPCGAGLFSFGTIDEALDGIHRVSADYRFHSQAARTLAHEYFDSGKVLTKLMRRLDAA